MSTALFEINDSGINVSLDGQSILSSPGYAVLDGKRLLVGSNAMANARLLPRWTNTRFWHQLDTDSLNTGVAAVRHHADLVLAHIEAIRDSAGAIKNKADQVMLAVPGIYSRDQLSLLAGIFKEAGLPLTSMVDTSLAAAAEQSQRDTLLHLDIHLHRVLLSNLETDGNLRRCRTQVVAETGLFTLWDRWANIIANQFIQTSRFDPLHQAATEQILFDQLPAWIANRGSAANGTFELMVNDTVQRVSVSNDQLLDACAGLYPQIIQTIRAQAQAHTTLLLSHRFAGFPGLLDSLALLNNVTIVWLEPNAVSRGTQAQLQRLQGDTEKVAHITSLPAPAADASVAAEPATRQVTHLLHGNHATVIGAGLNLSGANAEHLIKASGTPRLALYRRANQVYVEAAADAGVTLNQQPLQTATRVEPGNLLQIDGQPLTLISTD